MYRLKLETWVGELEWTIWSQGRRSTEYHTCYSRASSVLLRECALMSRFLIVDLYQPSSANMPKRAVCIAFLFLISASFGFAQDGTTRYPFDRVGAELDQTELAYFSLFQDAPAATSALTICKRGPASCSLSVP